MNKFFTVLLFIASAFSLKSQVNQMVSDSAFFVMEVDLGKVVKSVPVEELNKLEVVQSIMQDFNIGSGDIKDLSNLGVDFSSKLIVFNIEKSAYTSFNVIIPLKDKQKFIKTLSQEEQAILGDKGTLEKNGKVISITDQTCVMSNIDWKRSYYREKTRLFFEDNDWELPDNYYYFHQYDFIEDDIYDVEEAADAEEFEDYIEEEEIIEIQEEAGEDYYEEDFNEHDVQQLELENKFKRILDSITEIGQNEVINQHLNFIKQPTRNLYNTDELYKKVSNATSDAKIYINPLMNNNMMNDFMYYPIKQYMMAELEEMRQFAYVNFTSEGIQLDWNVQVSDDMVEVMKEAASKKIDKKLLKYIPTYAQGIALYNVNAFGAYEKFKEIYMPKLDESDDPYMLMASAVWSTIDEFVDLEAIASVYPPKVLASYSGFKEVEMSRVTYEYDEETFEYTEMDTTYMENIPMMTFAMANERAYLIEKYMKALIKMDDEKIIKKNDYYTIHYGPFDLGIPYHIAVVDDVILLTNDETVMQNNLNGFSGKAFDRKILKKAKKAKLFYAHMDFNSIYEDLSKLGFVDGEKFMRLFNDKTGTVDLELASISKNQAHYKMSINTNEAYANGGYFLFELLNSIYLFSK